MLPFVGVACEPGTTRGASPVQRPLPQEFPCRNILKSLTGQIAIHNVVSDCDN